MRTQIVHPGAGELKYEIRGIVAKAKAVEARSTYAYETLKDVTGVAIHPARGAFYMTVVFTPARDDRKFVYDLLEKTGVCVVPLSSGFNSRLSGFRFTLLEPDFEKFKATISTLKATLVV